jgi:hypothetical protein
MSDQTAIAITIDWKTQTVVFTEQAINGIITVNPPSVTVPLALIMRLAAEMIQQSLPPQLRQMQFAAPVVQEPENTRGGRSLAFDAKIGPH